MDLLALRYFQAVARLEHVGRAAEQLHVAQPSLSRTLARLETDLGVPLFDRQGRRIRLNQFGTAFLSRVDRILAEVDNARQELADTAGLDRGTVGVAAETLLTVTELLQSFVAEHPADVRLFQSSASTMAEQLRNGDVQLCVASQPLSGVDVSSKVVLDEPVMLCVPAGHHLASRQSVSISDLAGEPFVTTRRGCWPRELAERLFGKAGVDLHIVCESDEPGVMGDLIGAGLGVGFMPGMCRGARSRTPMAWLEVDDPDCRRVLSVVWRDDTYLSAAARRFRDHTIEHFASPA
ncbi:LysR family transcriptional regulator [Kibdelosporangium philippinense]|uniref:LysR family transcriptional regulator n=1 Tax=Kibdelosporangium philippinense TaxID=211113 RepID=A0ABS8ZKD6_9PSEU|nr:LysR family transcriptional regulator [Kibdelosporangium philippinense]MCE7008012.1 LysR family transcriptional regulator [Kibdelosporangium philippinense]